jgi:predicted outer membrane repeat protein
MLTVMMHIRTAWNDYFTGSPVYYQQNLYTSGQTLSDTSVCVLNCLFSSSTSTNHGGALFCTSVSYLLVESSSFFSCKTSNSYGGAIYFSNSNGQCVLNEVCGFDCCSTYASGSSHYQFAYLYVNNAISSKNYVNYSSIVRCVNDRSNSYTTLYLSCGKIYCPSINMSMNKCVRQSGIYFCPTSDSYSSTGSLLFSSFADNIATQYTCIRTWWGGSKIEIKSCNILRNTQGSLSSTGTIYTLDNIMIDDSCILENKADYIFYIYSSSYTITLSNCTVDSTSNNGYMTIRNTITKSFIHALNHISTQNCHSKYDSVGYLTPNIQTNKQIQCFTYCKCFCHPRLSAIIYIFNFIHPHASVDL